LENNKKKLGAAQTCLDLQKKHNPYAALNYVVVRNAGNYALCYSNNNWLVAVSLDNPLIR